uniref:ATP synthase complex subunit 8 n=1 Tax=Scolytinae sp. BMNH 1274277 TaxID=2558032 RepID=A0A126TF17_9CUCU|nr:ATP synthase F0 subunit 8 [Scolytinae sp. BMNH 1274277]
MPQMAPISWICLYLFFSILFMLVCIMNYYTFSYKPTNKTMTSNKILSLWKW